MTDHVVGQNRDQGVALDSLLSGLVDPATIPSVMVSGLQLDSRAVKPGDLFVALSGQHSHGLNHADQAIEKGCAAIIHDPVGAAGTLDVLGQCPAVPVEGLQSRLGLIADRFFGEPSRDLTVIAVTGTNGKTSCSHFVAEALQSTQVAATIGTLGWGIPGQLKSTTHTTPNAVEVHRLLDQLRGAGCRTVVMEASSHGLAQGRLNGVRFQGALFTNFSRDHLDYHGTMEAYRDAKLALLDWPDLKFVVFNAGDAGMAEAILNRVRPGIALTGFALDPAVEARVPLMHVSSISHHAGGIGFSVDWQGETTKIKAPVFGDFNVENLAAALGVLLALGWPLTNAGRALVHVSAVPGRMDIVSDGNRGAVVDFAHTPDALDSVLTSLRQHCRGRLWVVFGCGGDRDRGKRSEMGGVADRLADVLVLTDDNPRSEDGDAIIADILTGVSRRDVSVIRDRRAAIQHALNTAAEHDLVLVAGKGHETTQEIDGQKYPFSDRLVVQEILQTLRA